MGVIWLAEEVALKRPVVLRSLRPELLRDEHFLERFRYEAMAGARSRHPVIVTVYSIGHAQGQPQKRRYSPRS